MVTTAATILLSILCSTSAFTVVVPATKHHKATGAFILSPPPPSFSTSKSILYAGGFEWEDPAEEFDQGVDNPYKNPELNLLKDSSADQSKEEDGEDGPSKIDPARLLGPRLNGSNLYFVGMMGSGKSAVGDVVARRELFNIVLMIQLFVCFIFWLEGYHEYIHFHGGCDSK